jgi:hypothetical protein
MSAPKRSQDERGLPNFPKDITWERLSNGKPMLPLTQTLPEDISVYSSLSFKQLLRKYEDLRFKIAYAYNRSLSGAKYTFDDCVGYIAPTPSKELVDREVADLALLFQEPLPLDLQEFYYLAKELPAELSPVHVFVEEIRAVADVRSQTKKAVVEYLKTDLETIGIEAEKSFLLGTDGSSSQYVNVIFSIPRRLSECPVR